MRSPEDRLKVLEDMVTTCVEGVSSLPKKLSKKDMLALAVAKTKYIGVATTALKEMGSIVRKELTGPNKVREKIKGAKTIADLQGIMGDLGIDPTTDQTASLKA